ncbi:MAG: TDT family transporter [Finegoldia sp.]|nr:TDT family transporter [Finegoldia sp.]
MIKKIPLPMAGLALALASLGNILGVILPFIRPVLGIISATLWILVLLNVISYPKLFLADMKNPVIASSFCTFSMAAYILSGYIKPYFEGFGKFLYFAALSLHIILIIYFTYTFMIKNFDLKTVHASYYITYVGIVTSAIVAIIWDANTVGKAVFVFGLVTYIPLFYIVNRRYISLPEVDNPHKPLFCVQIATPALLLAGYHSAFVENKSKILISILCLIAICFYLYVVLTKLKTYIKLPFYPSFAALTFPMVINPIAQKLTAEYFQTIGSNFVATILNLVWMVQLVLATLVVFYVLIRYVEFLIKRV